MPRIENYITQRVITRTTSPATSPGARLTLKDVKMPRKGNLDDIRPDEPTVMDTFHRSILADIRQRQKLDKFVNSRPTPSLRPRLIRPHVTPIATVSEPGQPAARLDEPKAARVRSIYDRHSLTSRGQRLSGDIAARLRQELAQVVSTNPLIRTYPPLR